MLKTGLAVTGVLLAAFGAEPLYHAATNRARTSITCEAFADSPPRALWLRVTGCEVDYMGAGYRESRGRIVELYFPARPAAWPATAPAPIVATTRDPSVLALAEGTIGGGRTPDQEQFVVMMLKIVTALRAAREIEGYAKSSVLSRLNARSAAAALNTPVSPRVVVIDLHARPTLLMPTAVTVTGVLLVGLLVFRRSKRRAETPATVASDAAEPPLAQASEPRLHVLLLNLPEHVDRDAIEGAPPLGEREQVIAALAHAVSGLEFDSAGRATLIQPGLTMLVDIGRRAPVHTVVIDARGPGAPRLVRRILDQTGWRAFAPKAGAFIEKRAIP